MAGLYRRGKVYWARANRQNREHRRSLKTADRAIAEKRLRAWLDELDAIAWGDKPRHTLCGGRREIHSRTPDDYQARGRVRYGVSLKHLSEHFAGKMLHQITKAELAAFETKRRTPRREPVPSAANCLPLIAVTSCEEWEWIDDCANFVPAYMRRRAKRGLKEAPARTRYLTVVEERKLLDSGDA